MYGASELMLKGRRPSNKSAYVGYGSGRADCLSTFVHRGPGRYRDGRRPPVVTCTEGHDERTRETIGIG